MVVVRQSYEPAVGAVGFGAKPIFSESKSARPKVVKTPPPNAKRLSNGMGGFYTIPKQSELDGLPPAKVVIQHSKMMNSRSKTHTAAAQSPFPRSSVKRPRSTRKPAQKQKRSSTPSLLRLKSSAAAVHKLSQQACKSIEDAVDCVQEYDRKRTAKRRISQTLVGLRAASIKSRSIRTMNVETSGSKLQMVVGDLGLALFSPIDDEYFCEAMRRKQRADGVSDDSNRAARLETEDYPVELKPESDLTSCPRLLTAKMIHQLIEEALPVSLKTARWDRVYALGRDGDDFHTMTRSCAPFKNTIIVAQTSQGHILGGYAAAPWVRQEGYDMTRSFFGTGESFLFANHPSERSQQEETLHVYKWTGNNTYSQVCDVDDGQLAMGGGGSFGLVIQENFSRGSTGHCSTFGNPPLIPKGGVFCVVNFEVYGFTSLGDTLRQEHYC